MILRCILLMMNTLLCICLYIYIVTIHAVPYNWDLPIRGVGYQPSPPNYDPRLSIKKPYSQPDLYSLEYIAFWHRDFSLLRDMNCSTIRIWGWNEYKDHSLFLDIAYEYNLLVMITFDPSFSYDKYDPMDTTPMTMYSIEERFRQTVRKYQDHPAVYMYLIGNEVNRAYSHNQVMQYMYMVEKLSMIRDEECNMNNNNNIMNITCWHPISVPLADSIELNNNLPLYLGTIESIYPKANDVYTVQIYRGSNFGTLFGSYRIFQHKFNIPYKPLLIAEFGYDAINNEWKYDENEQSQVIISLWNDIISRGMSNYNHDYNNNNQRVLLGAVVFEFLDENYKATLPDANIPSSICPAKSSSSQAICGYETNNGLFHNEAYFGLFRYKKNNDNKLYCIVPRKAYYSLKYLWLYNKNDSNNIICHEDECCAYINTFAWSWWLIGVVLVTILLSYFLLNTQCCFRKKTYDTTCDNHHHNNNQISTTDRIQESKEREKQIDICILEASQNLEISQPFVKFLNLNSHQLKLLIMSQHMILQSLLMAQMRRCGCLELAIFRVYDRSFEAYLSWTRLNHFDSYIKSDDDIYTMMRRILSIYCISASSEQLKRVCNFICFSFHSYEQLHQLYYNNQAISIPSLVVQLDDISEEKHNMLVQSMQQLIHKHNMNYDDLDLLFEKKKSYLSYYNGYPRNGGWFSVLLIFFPLLRLRVVMAVAVVAISNNTENTNIIMHLSSLSMTNLHDICVLDSILVVLYECLDVILCRVINWRHLFMIISYGVWFFIFSSSTYFHINMLNNQQNNFTIYIFGYVLFRSIHLICAMLIQTLPSLPGTDSLITRQGIKSNYDNSSQIRNFTFWMCVLSMTLYFDIYVLWPSVSGVNIYALCNIKVNKLLEVDFHSTSLFDFLPSNIIFKSNTYLSCTVTVYLIWFVTSLMSLATFFVCYVILGAFWTGILVVLKNSSKFLKFMILSSLWVITMLACFTGTLLSVISVIVPLGLCISLFQVVNIKTKWQSWADMTQENILKKIKNGLQPYSSVELTLNDVRKCWNMVMNDYIANDLVSNVHNNIYFNITNNKDFFAMKPIVNSVTNNITRFFKNSSSSSSSFPATTLQEDEEEESHETNIVPLVEQRTVTVLVPLFSETVLYTKHEILSRNDNKNDNKHNISLLEFLIQKHTYEWNNLSKRIFPLKSTTTGEKLYNMFLSEQLNEHQTMEILQWVSLRGQTLFRTIRGINRLRKVWLLQAELQHQAAELINEKLQVIIAAQVFGERKRHVWRKTVMDLLDCYPYVEIVYNLNVKEDLEEKLRLSISIYTNDNENNDNENNIRLLNEPLGFNSVFRIAQQHHHHQQLQKIDEMKNIFDNEFINICDYFMINSCVLNDTQCQSNYCLANCIVIWREILIILRFRIISSSFTCSNNNNNQNNNQNYILDVILGLLALHEQLDDIHSDILTHVINYFDFTENHKPTNNVDNQLLFVLLNCDRIIIQKKKQYLQNFLLDINDNNHQNNHQNKHNNIICESQRWNNIISRVLLLCDPYYSIHIKYNQTTKSCEIINLISRKRDIRLGNNGIQTNGKSENQCHCFPFIRGELIQTLDMNQDLSIFEAWKVQTFLSEFGFKNNIDNDDNDDNIRISDKPKHVLIGCPETIYTIDLTCIGRYTALQDYAFTSLIQYHLDWTKVRLHYGHTDIIESYYSRFHITLSKASCIINLSEDVFFGLDAQRRNKTSTFVQYINYEKGREVGLDTSAIFEDKISRGSSMIYKSIDLYQISRYIPFFTSLSLLFGLSAHFLYCSLFDFAITSFCWVLFFISVSNIQVEHMGFLDSIYAIPWILHMGSFFAFPLLMQLVLDRGIVSGMIKFMKNLLLGSMFYLFHLRTKSIAFTQGLNSTVGGSYSATGRGINLYSYSFIDVFIRYYSSHYHHACELLLIVTLYVAYSDDSFFWTGLFKVYAVIFAIFSWLISPALFQSSIDASNIEQYISTQLSLFFQFLQDRQEENNPNNQTWEMFYYGKFILERVMIIKQQKHIDNDNDNDNKSTIYILLLLLSSIIPLLLSLLLSNGAWLLLSIIIIMQVDFLSVFFLITITILLISLFDPNHHILIGSILILVCLCYVQLSQLIIGELAFSPSSVFYLLKHTMWSLLSLSLIMSSIVDISIKIYLWLLRNDVYKIDTLSSPNKFFLFIFRSRLFFLWQITHQYFEPLFIILLHAGAVKLTHVFPNLHRNLMYGI